MENTTYQFSSKKMWEVFKKQFGWVVAFAIIIGCLGAFYGEFMLKDSYTSSVTYILTDVGGASNSDLAQMHAHVERYRKTLTSRNNVIAEVTKKAHITVGTSEETGEPVYAVSEMAAATKVTTDEVAGTFTITVSCSDSKVSWVMIQAFKSLIPEISEEYNLYPVKELDPGSSGAPTVPSNGGRALKYGIFGAAIGAVLSYLIFLVSAVLDVTIRNEEDLAEVIDLPLLGEIPQYTGTVATGDKILNEMNQLGKNEAGKETK